MAGMYKRAAIFLYTCLHWVKTGRHEFTGFQRAYPLIILSISLRSGHMVIVKLLILKSLLQNQMKKASARTKSIIFHWFLPIRGLNDRLGFHLSYCEFRIKCSARWPKVFGKVRATENNYLLHVRRQILWMIIFYASMNDLVFLTTFLELSIIGPKRLRTTSFAFLKYLCVCNPLIYHSSFALLTLMQLPSAPCNVRTTATFYIPMHCCFPFLGLIRQWCFLVGFWTAPYMYVLAHSQLQALDSAYHHNLLPNAKEVSKLRDF